MSREVNNSLNLLIEGLGLDSEGKDFCDFTIADQNSVAESQGITPTTPSNFKPVLGGNVTYVVACVIINEFNEVLMMQEAKESCAGKWYLPAGRMEKGETIVQAAVREVLEETGLQCDLKTLLVVETAGGSWYRFVLTGEIIGGELKTPARADKESLQAKWISSLEEITLRANDIIHLIEKAKLYKQTKPNNWHKEILPASTPHTKDLLRLIVVIKKRSTNRLHVLLSEKTSIHFPTSEINPNKSLHSTLRRFMVEMFGADVSQHRPLGLLNVEADPSADGCCLTLLVAFRSPLEEVPLIGKCAWQEVSQELEKKLLIMITNKNSTIELHVVR
ncbi:8-oxo-dGDP phosphatase NUDT18 [Bombyx mandarina]|uniref:Nudix hydrolase domain-containing protein n=2 Tax=Bombyx TaxID=7090 RepID=A0A8R2HQP4_BOMMO|nr:8-oxo-dGDP phosphatase NUDT18 [Bombyx mori]XP_028038055.1 8-oxo-dGDP phosphatase NUDT18 [Bombyx mandarina]